MGAHKPSGEVQLTHFSMGRLRLREVKPHAQCLSALGTQKNQDVNTKRVPTFFCKEEVGLGVGRRALPEKRSRVGKAQGKAPPEFS